MNIEDKIYFSKTLNQHFRFCRGGIIFEDKVVYTNEELELIKTSTVDPVLIHATKLFFDAAIISPEDLKELTVNYEDTPSDFKKAVDFASKLMKDGAKGSSAIFEAARKFNIAPQSIGRELGKR